MTQATGRLQAMDGCLLIVAAICRCNLGLFALSRVIMDLKSMDLPALFMAAMESGIQEQPQTVEVKEMFWVSLGPPVDERKKIITIQGTKQI